MQNKKYTVFILLFAVASVLLSFLPIGISFTSQTKALVKPIKEWELNKTTDGNLTSYLTDNSNGSVMEYSITEFQRGDAVKFVLNSTINDGIAVNVGDTLGFFYSNEEQTRLVSLIGELEVLKAELDFWATGQKPEDVAMAQSQLLLAQQEFDIQQKLMERTEVLMNDSVVSIQQYEIAKNEYEVKKLAKKLAENRLQSVITGEKPEQIHWIASRIKVTEQQIQQVKERLNYFTLKAPISGIVAIKRSFISSESIVQIIDTSAYIGIAPILFSNRGNFEIGDLVEVTTYGAYKGLKGEIIAFDNVSQMVNGKSVIFATISFHSHTSRIVTGSLFDVKLFGNDLKPYDYLTNVFKSPR
jgi:hypothetical protein